MVTIVQLHLFIESDGEICLRRSSTPERDAEPLTLPREDQTNVVESERRAGGECFHRRRSKLLPPNKAQVLVTVVQPGLILSLELRVVASRKLLSLGANVTLINPEADALWEHKRKDRSWMLAGCDKSGLWLEQSKLHGGTTRAYTVCDVDSACKETLRSTNSYMEGKLCTL